MENKVQEDMTISQTPEEQRIMKLFQDLIDLHKRAIELEMDLIKKLQTKESEVDKFNEDTFTDDFYPKLGGTELRAIVGTKLQNVGVPPHILGYYYLREGISLALEKSETMEMLTRDFYGEVGKKFRKGWKQVEHSIRYAINSCLARGNNEEFNSCFGNVINKSTGKIKSSEFIFAIIEKINAEINIHQI